MGQVHLDVHLSCITNLINVLYTKHAMPLVQPVHSWHSTYKVTA